MKDLNKFKEESKKERPLGKDEGADDQEYMSIMSYYKNYARHNMKPREAQKYLNQALKLSRDGDVSKKAKLYGAYI